MTSEWIEATHIMKNRFELCRETWIKKHEGIKHFESRWNNLKLLLKNPKDGKYRFQRFLDLNHFVLVVVGNWMRFTAQ